MHLKVSPVGDHVRDGSGGETSDAEGIVGTGAYSWGLDFCTCRCLQLGTMYEMAAAVVRPQMQKE